jgi:NADH-quinone oxidoreductase subunit E
MLSEKAQQQIAALMDMYPLRRSALIPSLQLAQEEAGYLDPATLCEVARIFQISPSEVYEVASFYTLLFTEPMGKYVVQICTSISCLLCRSEDILDHLQKRLGIKPGETTPDKRFTLLEVECLASCGTAPVVQINDDYYENLTIERIDKILDNLS